MNNNIRIYNTSRDAAIIAHVARNHSKTPFVVTDIKVFDSFDTHGGYIIEPPALQYVQIFDTITNDDNNYKHSTFKSANIGCDAEFNICTYTNDPTNPSSVGKTITMGETIDQLNMRIIVPAAIIDACVDQNDKVFTVVVNMGRPMTFDNGIPQPDYIAIEPNNTDPGELMRRTYARSAKGYIIIDGFGEVSFTWSNG